MNILSLQYLKPAIVTELERDVLLLLKDVETETDDLDDIDLMKQLMG